MPRKAKPKNPEQGALPATAGTMTAPSEPRSPETTRGGALRLNDDDLFPPADVWQRIQEIADVLIGAGTTGKCGANRKLVIACILKGRELGIGPNQALEGLYPQEEAENGQKSVRWGMAADLMRALVARSGVGVIDVVAMEPERVTVRAIRFARGKQPEMRREFTWDKVRAERAGLWGKNSYWQKYPEGCQLGRASSEAGRAYFSDILAGASYTPEELEVGVPSPPPPTPQADASAGATSKPAAGAVTPPPAPARSETPPAKPVEAVAGQGAHQEGAGKAPESPVQPSDGAPPTKPPPTAEERAQRVRTHPVNLDAPGGGVVVVMTGGMTKAQVGTLQRLTTQQGGYVNWETLRGLGGEWVKAQGFPIKPGEPGALYATEAEADELIARLLAVAEDHPTSGANGQGAAPPATSSASGPTNPQWVAIRAQLSQLVNERGLPSAETEATICRVHSVTSLEELAPAALQLAVDEIRTLATDAATWALAMERMKQDREIGG